MCYPVEIMNDISRVCVAEVGHRYADLLVVFLQVDPNALLQLVRPSQWSSHRVLVHDTAVEPTLIRNLNHHHIQYMILNYMITLF